MRQPQADHKTEAVHLLDTNRRWQCRDAGPGSCRDCDGSGGLVRVACHRHGGNSVTIRGIGLQNRRLLSGQRVRPVDCGQMCPGECGLFPDAGHRRPLVENGAMRRLEIEELIRPLVRKLQPYVPGEQPRIKGLIKLNTNENPYPPAPAVLQATRAAVDGRLRLYPNPTSAALRERLAKLHRCQPENIMVGNGSDELLAMAVRAFVEPGHPYTSARYRHTVQYFDPSYSLYPVLAETHGSVTNGTPLNPDFTIPPLRELHRGRGHVFNAALTFITTPNAPSGRSYPLAQLEGLCRAHTGVVVLDEAYVDFAAENAMCTRVEVSARARGAHFFQGLLVVLPARRDILWGTPKLIGALHKIRDSYNVNGLGQVAALATLDELGLLPGGVQANHRHARAGVPRTGGAGFPGDTQ